METIKIKANNLEDFEKQYYRLVNYIAPFESLIELETDDNFWNILTIKEAEKQLNRVYPDVDINNVLIIELYHPKYGNIKYINKNK